MDGIDLTAWGDFQKQMIRRMEYFGLSAAQIVRQQASYFAKGLMKIVPPKDRKKTMAGIEARVISRFGKLSNLGPEHRWNEDYALYTKSDVLWYTWTKTGLFGVARDRDMHGASTKKLVQLFYSITKKGRRKVGQRGKQTVFLWQGVMVGAKDISRVIKYLQRHIGRLKAAWLPSWRQTGSLGGSIPSWIFRHESGARGGFSDQLGIKDNPAFTLINFAVGAGAIDAWFINKELRLRANAMARDLELYINGTKKIGDAPSLDASTDALWEAVE